MLAENGRTRYLTGYQRYFSATYIRSVHAVVATLDAGPILLLPRHVMGTAAECSAERAVEYPRGEDAQVETLARLLEELGVADRRVGIEFDFLHHSLAAKLTRRLRGADIVDATPLMRQVTGVKFPAEIALLREAARMVDLGMAAAVAATRQGTTEIEIAARASGAMLDAGAEFIHHMTVRSGPHASGLHPVVTPRAIDAGDCVQIDIGCVHRGYVSDTNRTVVVGPPTAEQRRLLRVGQDMLEAGIAAVRPGVTADAVWRACRDVAARAGMEGRITIPFVGHGIGLNLHEEPYIAAGSMTILEENMVFALEPGVYADGIGGSRPEDMLRVTADGCELLTHFPRDFDMLGNR